LMFGRMGNNQHFHNGDGEQGYGTPTDRPAYHDEEWGDTSRASSRQGSRNSRTPGQFGDRRQFPWSMADGPGFGSGYGTQGVPTHGISSKWNKLLLITLTDTTTLNTFITFTC
jgi:hypothetical protein